MTFAAEATRVEKRKAFEALLKLSIANWEKDDAISAEAQAAAMNGVRKAILLMVGSPAGTILRHKVDGTTATRGTTIEGIPIWQVADLEGNKWDYTEPILEPEDDWKCIYDPEKEN